MSVSLTVRETFYYCLKGGLFTATWQLHELIITVLNINQGWLEPVLVFGMSHDQIKVMCYDRRRKVILTVWHTLVLNFQILVGSRAGVWKGVRSSYDRTLGPVITSVKNIYTM